MGENDYQHFRLEGDTGLAYVRQLQDSAEKADKFMFEITRNNFLALGALCSFGSVGLYSISSNRPAIIWFVGLVIVAISIGAAILSFFYHRYSSYLYARAWTAEKAWLRGKRTDHLLEAIRLENAAFRAARFRKHGAVSEGRGQWRTSFYFWVNLIPAIAGGLMIAGLYLGFLSVGADSPQKPQLPTSTGLYFGRLALG